MSNKITIKGFKNLKKHKRVIAGIYKIFLDDMLFYIGRSDDVYSRLRQHSHCYIYEKHQKALKLIIDKFKRYNVSGLIVEIYPMGKQRSIDEEIKQIIQEKPLLNRIHNV